MPTNFLYKNNDNNFDHQRERARSAASVYYIEEEILDEQKYVFVEFG